MARNRPRCDPSKDREEVIRPSEINMTTWTTTEAAFETTSSDVEGYERRSETWETDRYVGSPFRFCRSLPPRPLPSRYIRIIEPLPALRCSAAGRIALSITDLLLCLTDRRVSGMYAGWFEMSRSGRLLAEDRRHLRRQ